ncbi:sperm flagellar protein 1 isoform X2 [Amia ocellicauda]|uniref:sperm flagellar protein 1 isoform X2 n=1 Tax=Amia ocellicauda TaxID=2972642 RepID=UPI00346493AA
MNTELNEETLQDLYAWIDTVPLSRPKRNIARDFSDRVMAAEVVKCFFPRLVELHNYIPANSTQQKLSNWGTLNRQVFSKLNFHVPEEVVKKIVLSTAGVVEPVLCMLRDKIEEKRAAKSSPDTQKAWVQDLEYYSARNERSKKEYTQMPTIQSYRTQDQKRGEWTYNQTDSNPSSVDPAVHLLMDEKEQALLALQETVEILQMKVNRLEHLVQLKDLRIEDLTRHLERYKARANMK